MMPNSSATPCLPLCKTALSAKAGQSLAAFCLIRELSEPYGKQHSKTQASKLWKQWQEQCESYLHQIGNEIGCVGFLFLTSGITDLMNMVAILHHCRSGWCMWFDSSARDLKSLVGHRNDVPWLQVKGPGSASFPWLPAWPSGHRCSPLPWDLAFPLPPTSSSNEASSSQKTVKLLY